MLRAVRNRSIEIVQLLLDKKARVTAADKEGDTVLHIAMRARSKVSLFFSPFGLHHIIAFLISTGNSRSTPPESKA